MSIEDNPGDVNEVPGADNGAEAQNQPEETLLGAAGNKGDAPPPENNEGDQGKQEATPESEVPEKYDFKAPDGMEYDQETIDIYAEAATEAGLSQEKADIILGKIAPHLAQQQIKAVEKASAEWEAASRADAEFGGDKLNENMAVAAKAMEKFATPELKTLLNESRLGNNPEVIRLFYRVGKAISEDGFVSATGAPQNSDARALFPNTKNLNP
nr:MAG TPA: putative protease [Caudoviricetes sp.]